MATARFGRDRSPRGQGSEIHHARFVRVRSGDHEGVELLPIAPLEFLPAGRVVPELPTEFHILRPGVKRGSGLRMRPKADHAKEFPHPTLAHRDS
jgi:hypothetical protein